MEPVETATTALGVRAVLEGLGLMERLGPRVARALPLPTGAAAEAEAEAGMITSPVGTARMVAFTVLEAVALAAARLGAVLGERAPRDSFL